MTRRMSILIADDSEIDREILCELFKEDFDIIEAENGFEAISKAIDADKKHILAAAMLDVAMPIINGLAVLGDIREVAARVPVILMSAESTPEKLKQGHELGMADFVVKPFRGPGVKKRVHTLIDNFEERNAEVAALFADTEEKTKKISDFGSSVDMLAEMLGAILEYKGIETRRHLTRMRLYTKALLTCVSKHFPEYALNDETINTISSAASLHDIGKLIIPDNVLFKSNGLTQADYEAIKAHTTNGSLIVNSLRRFDHNNFVKYCNEICRYHHERWDGNGYPDKLRGDAIPIGVQAVAIADIYDALTAKISYRKSFSHERAVSMISNGECGSFSPKILQCFKIISEQFKLVAANYQDA